MHEEAVFRELRTALEAVARREQVARIVRARVRIGALSHLSEDRLREEWPRLVDGGPAAGAALEVVASTDLGDPSAASVVLESVDV